MIFATVIFNIMGVMLYGSTTRALYLCLLSVLYQLIETLYLAYTTLNMLAFWVVILGYTPFIVSLLRMWWHDTERRRLILYHSFYLTCTLSFFIDAWMHNFTFVFSEDMCHYTDCMPNVDTVRSLL